MLLVPLTGHITLKVLQKVQEVTEYYLAEFLPQALKHHKNIINVVHTTLVPYSVWLLLNGLQG